MSEERTVEAGWRCARAANLACALGLFVVASAGHAATSVNVEVGGRTSVCPGYLDFGLGAGSGDGGAGPIELSETRTDPVHGSTIIATAVSNYGFMGAMAYASVGNGPCEIGPGYLIHDVASAVAKATFWDEITVVGPPGTPLGTFVDIEFHTSLSGYILPLGYTGNDAYLQLCVGPYVGLCPVDLESQSFGNSPVTRAGTLHVAVGSELVMYGLLMVRATALSNYPGPLGSFTTNFRNTAVMYADPLTPGWSLVSRSGHDYSAPVPEPSTLALLGLGVVGLGAARHRRIGRRASRPRAA